MIFNLIVQQNELAEIINNLAIYIKALISSSQYGLFFVMTDSVDED